MSPSAPNESLGIVIKVSARDITQDWSALALISVKTQTRKYSLPQRNEMDKTKQTKVSGRE